MNTQTPTPGRIVRYTLTAQDAEQITRRRTTGSAIAVRLATDPPAWPAGAQAHIGNPVAEGSVFPMMITEVHISSEMVASVNGQVFLDGNDVLWATSRTLGEGPGHFQWPARV